MVTNNFSTPSSKELFDDGGAVSLGGFFILDDSRFLERKKNGKLQLTPYAKDIFECFRIEINSESHYGRPLPESEFSGSSLEDPTSRTKSKSSNSTRRFKEELFEEIEFNKKYGFTFCDEVCAHMMRRGCNRVVFSKMTGLSDRTYDRIVRHSLNRPNPDTVMSICVGLNLGFEFSLSLFQKAGYCLGGTDTQIAYRKILLTLKDISIHECNEILKEMGLPELNSKYQGKK